MSDHGDLIINDGQAHCPCDECDWWVPEGMEYLYSMHLRADHDEFCKGIDRNR